MSPQAAPRRTLEDIERLGRVPLDRRLAVNSTYELLQAAQAKLLFVPGPEVSQELWQKTEQLRGQVKSIAMVLQVRRPGNERESVYSFNALIEDYPADRLHTGREIALDDLAIILPTRNMIGTPSLAPLTHGNLLYTTWALGLVTSLMPDEVLLRSLSHFFQEWWPTSGP